MKSEQRSEIKASHLLSYVWPLTRNGEQVQEWAPRRLHPIVVGRVILRQQWYCQQVSWEIDEEKSLPDSSACGWCQKEQEVDGDYP